MLTWTLIFLTLWLVWGLIGFAFMADTAAWIARGLSIVFAFLAAISVAAWPLGITQTADLNHEQ